MKGKSSAATGKTKTRIYFAIVVMSMGATLVLPGLEVSHDGYWEFSGDQEYVVGFTEVEHGWPWPFLFRSTGDIPGNILPPYLTTQGWSFAGVETRFYVGVFLADLLLAIALPGMITYFLFAKDQSKRIVFLQFSSRALIVSLMIASAGLAYYLNVVNHYDYVRREFEELDEQNLVWVNWSRPHSRPDDFLARVFGAGLVDQELYTPTDLVILTDWQIDRVVDSIANTRSVRQIEIADGVKASKEALLALSKVRSVRRLTIRNQCEMDDVEILAMFKHLHFLQADFSSEKVREEVKKHLPKCEVSNAS